MELVKKYDAVTPSTLPLYCNLMGITVEDFYKFVEPFRDENIWAKNSKNEWEVKDAVWKQKMTDKHIVARTQLSNDQTFSAKNKHLYFNENNPPEKTGVPALDVHPTEYCAV